MIDLQTTIDTLKDNGFDFITSYFNGTETFLGFDKERETEIIIKITNNPDEEDIKNFNENFIDETDLMQKDDEGEDEGLKKIQEHEDCTDIDEEMEAKADLHRKYDLDDIDGSKQENFCN